MKTDFPKSSRINIWPWADKPRRKMLYLALCEPEAEALAMIKNLCPSDCDMEIQFNPLATIREVEQAAEKCDLLIAEVHPALEKDVLTTKLRYDCSFFSKRFPSLIGTDMQEADYEELTREAFSA